MADDAAARAAARAAAEVAARYEAPTMDGRITRVEALRRIRERIPEFYITPPNVLSNIQLMECFPFENRKFVNTGDAANPIWVETVPEAECTAVIDVLTVFAEDGRAVEYEEDAGDGYVPIEANPFQDIQQEVRIITNNPGRTPAEIADSMYNAECFDPRFMRTIQEYAALNPDAPENALFAQTIRDIQGIPEADRTSCDLCLIDRENLFLVHTTRVGDNNHSKICISCLVGHLISEQANFVLNACSCYQTPDCPLKIYEYVLYKSLYRFDTIEAYEGVIPVRVGVSPKKIFFRLIKTNRSVFNQQKENLNIFDDATDPNVYLETFFTNYPGGIANIDTGAVRDDLDIPGIVRNLGLRGFVITEAVLREKMTGFAQRLNERIESVVRLLIDAFDHDLDDDELGEIIGHMARDLQIRIPLVRARELIDRIDDNAAAEVGMNVGDFRAEREAARARNRNAGAAAVVANAEQAERQRIIREIGQLRANAERNARAPKVAIDLALDGDDLICDTQPSRRGGPRFYVDRAIMCPYCYIRGEHGMDCFAEHHDPARNNGYCIGPVADAVRMFPFPPNPYRGQPNKAEWCGQCGRPMNNHRHYHISRPGVFAGVRAEDHQDPFALYAEDIRQVERACWNAGGGGRVEFYVRILAVRDQIIEDFTNGNYLFDDAMKQRIFNRTMSDAYIGQVERYMNSNRRVIEDNVARAVAIFNQRPRIDPATNRAVCVDRDGRSIQLVLDPPTMRPDWLPGPHWQGGGGAKKHRRTYKKRRSQKKGTRKH